MIIILFALFGVAAFAGTNWDPPGGLTAMQVKEWNESMCRWRVAEEPELAGYNLNVVDRDFCFAFSRAFIITQDENPEVSALLKQSYRNDVLVMYRDADGHVEVCHLVPHKRTYDLLDFDDLNNALLRLPGALVHLMRLLQQNIMLVCPTA